MIKKDLTEFEKGWITGFIESEGVFTTNIIKLRRKTKKGVKIYRYRNPAFYLVSKDRAALEMARDLLQMGKISRHGAIFHLDIRRKAESIRFVEFLRDKFRSRSKRQQFERWRKRVLQWKSRAWGRGYLASEREVNRGS